MHPAGPGSSHGSRVFFRKISDVAVLIDSALLRECTVQKKLNKVDRTHPALVKSSEAKKARPVSYEPLCFKIFNIDYSLKINQAKCYKFGINSFIVFN